MTTGWITGEIIRKIAFALQLHSHSIGAGSNRGGIGKNPPRYNIAQARRRTCDHTALEFASGVRTPE
jgi:hypothetical protein